MNPSFQFFPSTKITEGYLNSCIFNLQTGFMYSINKEKLQQLILDQDFLEFLQMKGAGIISSEKIEFIEDIKPKDKPYDLHCIIFESVVILDQTLDFLNHKKLIVNSIFIFLDDIQDILLLNQTKDKLMNLGVESISIHAINFELKNEDFNFLKDSFYIDIIEDSVDSEFTFSLIVNREFYSDSLNYSTRYHSKIVVDKIGNIYSDCDKILRLTNIDKTNNFSRSEFVQSIQNNTLWNAAKDKCDICSDCEYRYLCYDSRILKPRKDQWYSDEECSYNPYIGKIVGQPGHLSLSDMGIISNKDTFRIGENEVVDKNLKH